MNYFIAYCHKSPEVETSTLGQDLFVAIVGAFVGFGFSLWIYYNQLQKDAKLKEDERIQNYKNILIYYKQLITSILQSFNKQLDLVDEFLVEQKKDPLNLQILKQIHSNDFLRIKNIDNIGVFEAWGHIFQLDEDKIKQYQETNAALDFLEGTIDEIKRIYSGNTKQCYDELVIIKGIVDHIPDRFSNIGMEIANKLGEERWGDPFYAFIDNSIKIYHRLLKEEANFDRINNEFLAPIIQTILDQFKGVPFSGEILNLCRKARIKLTDVVNEVQTVNTQFEALHNRSAKALEILTKTKEKLDTL